MSENTSFTGYGIGGLFRRKLDYYAPANWANLIFDNYHSSSRTVVSFQDALPCHSASSFHVRRLLQRCCSSSAEIKTLLGCLYLVSSSLQLTSTLYYKHVDLFDTLNLFLYDSIFFWEIFPEWIFPLLTGISIFCLANPRSADFTRIFGGSGGNEGLGFLSICLDWQYISGSIYYQVLTNIDVYCFVTHLYYDYFSVANPMAIPLKAQFSNCIGCVLSLWASYLLEWLPILTNRCFPRVVFCGVYYMNIWKSKSFPLVLFYFYSYSLSLYLL